MSEAEDLNGGDIVDIEGFLDKDAVVDKTPVVINTNIPGGVKETMKESDKLVIMNPLNPVKSLVNGVVQVSRMGELVDQIATKDSISFADAENVNLVFESFTKSFRMAEFTLQPSKTNLPELRAFVTKAHKLRQESFVAEYKGFVVLPFAELSNNFQELKDNIRPTVVKAIESFSTDVRGWLSDTQNVLDQEVIHGSDTINLAKTPLRDVPTDFVTPRGNVELFKSALKNIQDASTSDDLQYLFKEMGGFSNDGHQFVSLLNLIEMFGSEELAKVLEDAFEDAEEALEELSEIIDDKAVGLSEFSVIQEFVVNNQDVTDEAVSCVRRCVNLHHFVRFLYVNLTVVLGFFKA